MPHPGSPSQNVWLVVSDSAHPATPEMAGGLAIALAGARSAEYHAKLSWRVLLVCIVASSGGLLFGYDLGVLPISG